MVSSVFKDVSFVTYLVCPSWQVAASVAAAWPAASGLQAAVAAAAVAALGSCDRAGFVAVVQSGHFETVRHKVAGSVNRNQPMLRLAG